mmetsp:Transcript_22530/g.49327  ORF Transcript_22530/g.49327 Transcript_22530/m.49327 type:complete len:211 (-) Transcript_22530:109-741(-)
MVLAFLAFPIRLLLQLLGTVRVEAGLRVPGAWTTPFTRVAHLGFGWHFSSQSLFTMGESAPRTTVAVALLVVSAILRFQRRTPPLISGALPQPILLGTNFTNIIWGPAARHKLCSAFGSRPQLRWTPPGSLPPLGLPLSPAVELLIPMGKLTPRLLRANRMLAAWHRLEGQWQLLFRMGVFTIVAPAAACSKIEAAKTVLLHCLLTIHLG